MRILILCFLMLVAAIPVRAQSSVPAPLLVKIVMAAVAYDRSIETRFGDKVEIGIVGADARSEQLLAVLDGYSEKKLKGKPIEIITLAPSELEHQELDLVFFSQPLGGDAQKWVDICRRKAATCVSTDEDGVAEGLPLGVALTASGKPKLLINLEAAKSVGANFSAQVLKLAKIVKTR